MRTRWLTASAIGTLTALALTFSGCSEVIPTESINPDSTPAPTSAPPDAQESLIAAARNLSLQSSRMTMVLSGPAGAMDMNGQFDPVAREGRFQFAIDGGGEQMRIETVFLGSDVYLQISDFELPDQPPGTWLYFDESQLPPGSPFEVMSDEDPAGAQGFINAVTTAEWTGDGTIAGEIDMLKAPDIDEQTLEILGEGPALAAFTARIDGDDRLVELIVDLNSVLPGMGTIESRYANFGEPVDLEPPPADKVVPLPDYLLGILEA